jgi:hypothetical protein
MNRKQMRALKSTSSPKDYIAYLEKTVKMQQALIDNQKLRIKVLLDTLDEIEAKMKALIPDV